MRPNVFKRAAYAALAAFALEFTRMFHKLFIILCLIVGALVINAAMLMVLFVLVLIK